MSKLSPIKINSLNHYFGKGSLKKQVLFNINLQVQPGQVIILMGQSGSGKTTLLTLIGGLRSVQEGNLQVLGQELNKANTDQLIKIRRKIGYIFQAHNLLTFLTASQNVQMSAKLNKNIPSKEIAQRCNTMLEAVGLGNRVNYYPDALSGGQKQRVAIARALVGNPELVLADEPTAALDSHSGRDVVNLLHKLAKEQNCAILIVTHDNRILDIADKIIYMEDGQLAISDSNFHVQQ
ncbi:MAG: DevA family ABC transporter ATP-binding protein [Crocosphaera sp.]|nr:DevA family ABC transporter ATP-binding protein [Crocosphaera sp.]